MQVTSGNRFTYVNVGTAARLDNTALCNYICWGLRDDVSVGFIIALALGRVPAEPRLANALAFHCGMLKEALSAGDAQDMGAGRRGRERD